MTIELSVATVVYVASCITVIGGAIGVLLKAKKALLQPLEDLEKKIESHDKFLDNDKKHLETIDYVLVELTESNTLLVESVRTLLSHAETGNNTGEIAREKQKLDAWLLKGKRYNKGDSI